MIKKRVIFLLVFSSFISRAIAEEGMWLPLLLKQLNEADMQSRGLKLTAEDIYSVNKSSLKDAIVQFGGGCTGEIISPKGLLLTNHHCGFGQLQSFTTVQNDYITNGYWAKDASQEFPCKGLTVTFIVRMEDVTARAMSGIQPEMDARIKDSLLRVNYSSISAEAIKGTDYNAFVRPFFYGNEHYLFVTEVFRDVRLVGAPPSSIGKFGGDTDNWAWPRHNGDFMLFRVYADKNNRPADYSSDNVPLSPRKFLPVSLKGISENDFTMVFGFPGRTNEYLSSYGVDLIQNVSNPEKIKIRESALNIIRKDIRASDTVRIQYASKHDRISNFHKKWIGEMNGLKKYNTIDRKKKAEIEFMTRLEATPGTTPEYKSMFVEFQVAYDKLKPVQRAVDYYSEITQIVDLFRLTGSLEKLIKLSSEASPDKNEIKKEVNSLRERLKGFYKNYSLSTDRKLCAALLEIYRDAFSENDLPDIFKTIRIAYKNDMEEYAKALFNKSLFVNEKKMIAFLDSYKASAYKAIVKDPVYVLSRSISEFYSTKIEKEYRKLNEQVGELNKKYMSAQREVQKEKKFYPDANSTLRVAYGKVSSYNPRDGVYYKWYTTLDGIIEKEDASNPEFYVPGKLKELHAKKEYGPYANKNGELPVAFIASNHTTGGNSGSPVLDAEGNLIGLNFDRNWEGTMSDVSYDPSQCRNISVDIRYVLFIVDKFAGAGYLVEEMKVVK